MGKTYTIRKKVRSKINKAKGRIHRKMKGSKPAAKVVTILAAALSLFFAGCATSEAVQPAKSQTQTNEFKDCVIVVASKCSVSNRIVTAEGTEETPAIELFGLAQSHEATGTTESYAPQATQTPTNDVKPDVDLHYNDAVGTGGNVAKGFLESLTPEAVTLLKQAVSSKKTGTIELTKKDGSTVTAECDNGTCTLSDGTKIDASSCTDCEVKSSK